MYESGGAQIVSLSLTALPLLRAFEELSLFLSITFSDAAGIQDAVLITVHVH